MLYGCSSNPLSLYPKAPIATLDDAKGEVVWRLANCCLGDRTLQVCHDHPDACSLVSSTRIWWGILEISVC